MDKQPAEGKPEASAFSDVAVIQLGILCCALAMVVVFAVAMIAR